MHEKNPPLVILALDGGESRFIHRWVQEGYLPTIASVMKRGCWGKTSGSEHIAELGTWHSLLSGISRSQHGYYYFRQLRPCTYDLAPFSLRDTKTLPFWSHLRERDKKIIAIDAPECDLVPGLAGVQLANWAIHEAAPTVLPACSEPADLLEEVKQTFGPKTKILEFKINNDLQEDRQVYRRFLQRIERKGALCRHLLRRGPFDLMVIGFHDAHTASHRFWKYLRKKDPGNRAIENNELTSAIRNIYQAIDREMGLLLEKLSSSVNVFIVSAYGMEDQYPTTGLMEAFCRKLGYHVPAASSPFLANLVRHTQHLLPPVCHAVLDRCLPASIQERLISNQFHSSTNWKKTMAFAIPSLYTSFVRINLQGREPEGIVLAGTEYEALLDRLENDLKQLIDPITGETPIRQISRTANLFSSSFPDHLPDLFIEWKPAFHFIQTLVHPKTQLIQSKPYYFRDSYHSMTGFVLGAGPSIPRLGDIGNISLLDLAPTFLCLMGEEVPHLLKGKPIKTLLTETVSPS